MLTGILDLHPRAGMKLRNSDKKDGYTAFYEELNETSV
jgi:hypothetical protein